MKENGRKKGQIVLTSERFRPTAYIAFFLLGFSWLVLFLEPPPSAVLGNVDHAWSTVLQHGAVAGMKVGSDLAFSYGPLGWMWTLEVIRIPDFPWVMLLFSAFCRIALFALVIWALPTPQRRLLAAVFFFASGFIDYGIDAAILFGLLVLIHAVVGARGWHAENGALGLTGAWFSVIALSKFSWAVAAAFSGAVMLTFLCFQLRKKALLAICIGGVVPPIFLLLLGRASPASLWLYLRNGFEISHGFSENMGLEGGAMAIVVLGVSLVVGLWVLAVCMDLSCVFRHPPLLGKSVVAEALVFCGLVLLSLKMSLTRADAVHLQTTPLFLIGCLVAFDPPAFRLGRSLNIAAGVAICGLVAFIYLRQPLAVPSNADLPESTAEILSFTSAERKILETRGFDILGNLQASLPVVPGRYSPRPVFQSYLTYTPALADLNKHHFDRSAPESLFLTRFPIDQRLWTMEDGKIFAEVLASWDPVRQVGPLLWMCPPAELPKNSSPQTSTSHCGEFGKWQRLSPSKDIVFLRFLDLPPSLKIFPLISGESGYVIACRYSDGTERVFRLPPGIAKTGFVVSPLIQSFRDITIFRQTSSSLAECVAFAVMPLRSETSRGSYDFEVTERKPQRPSDAKNIAFLPIQKFRGNTTPELAWINGVEFLQFAGGSVASLLAEPVFVEALSLVVEFPKGSNASASLCVESFTGNDRILWHSRDSGVANLRNFYLAEGESLILRTEGSGVTLVRDARLQLR